MGRQKSLKITYTNDENWFSKLVSQVKATRTDHTAAFDNEKGKGSFYMADIDWGLQVRKIEVVFRQPVIFSTTATTPAPKGHYVLLSNLSEQYIETNTLQQNLNRAIQPQRNILASILSGHFFF